MAIRAEATLGDYRQLLTWARRWDERRWAVGNARGLGRHLAQWVIARGETVVDVPPTATARIRELSRGGRRKNDVLDAAAAAAVAALRGETAPVVAEDASTVLGMLDEQRGNLTQQRTRTVNQLHALLRDLLPGGASTDLTADRAAAVLAKIRPVSPVERARKDLARELIADIRALDARLKANTRRMHEAVADSGSSLTDVIGIGPVVAARLLGRTGRASRFPTAAAFAVYAGVAPIDRQRRQGPPLAVPRGRPQAQQRAAHHRPDPDPQARQPRARLLRPQDRRRQDPQRGHALPQTPPRRPRLAPDAHRRTPTSTGSRPRRTLGATLTSSATGPTPTAGSSDKSLPEPAEPHPTTEPIPAT